jgi:hypothetical protein
MNKRMLIGLIACFVTAHVGFSQKVLVPKKRKDVFGKPKDYNDYTFYGLQVAGGLVQTLTRPDAANVLYRTTIDSRPIAYLIDPEGKPSYFLEAGMAHFPKKTSKLADKLNMALISYYDWGVGYKKINGYESTTITRYGAAGTQPSTEFAEGTFSNGHVYGRFSIHKNIHFNKTFYIDNRLGMNVDYRISASAKETYAWEGANTEFQKPLAIQMHYGIGLGIRNSRRSFWSIGVQIPFFGLTEWRKGSTAIKWFSSNYVPLQAQVKYIYLFKKKTKGCSTPGTEEDKRRNKEYMQNN